MAFISRNRSSGETSVQKSDSGWRRKAASSMRATCSTSSAAAPPLRGRVAASALAYSFQRIGSIGRPGGAAVHTVDLQLEEGHQPQVRASVHPEAPVVPD